MEKQGWSNTDLDRLATNLGPRIDQRPPQAQPVLRGEYEAAMDGIHDKVDSIASNMGDIATEVKRMAGTQQTMAHTQQQMLELQRRDREIAQRLENHIESSNRAFDRQEREFSRVVGDHSKPGKDAMEWINRWKHRLWLPIAIFGFISAAAAAITVGVIQDIAKAKIAHAVAAAAVQAAGASAFSPTQ